MSPLLVGETRGGAPPNSPPSGDPSSFQHNLEAALGGMAATMSNTEIRAMLRQQPARLTVLVGTCTEAIRRSVASCNCGSLEATSAGAEQPGLAISPHWLRFWAEAEKEAHCVCAGCRPWRSGGP